MCLSARVVCWVVALFLFVVVQLACVGVCLLESLFVCTCLCVFEGMCVGLFMC